MASTRTTFTLDEGIAMKAQKLGINVSAAARQGVTDAVRVAMALADRAAYREHPEKDDAFWTSVEAWGQV